MMWPDAGAPVRELSGPDDTSSCVADVLYPLAVLTELAPLLKEPARHFYLTKDPDRLPEYGSHVVAMLLEEERCKLPAYALQVGSVIRNMSDKPYVGFRLRPVPATLIGTSFFEYARDHASRMRSFARVRKGPTRVVAHPNIFRIPLGYQSQQKLPQLSMSERALDTFFAGDIATPFPYNDYRYWIPPTKTVTRRQLWSVLDTLRRSGEWNIVLDDVRPDNSASQPRSAKALNYQSYSERMMNSRICVAPRGSNWETYRFYEGLRAGCLVITSPFRNEPFLRGAPVITVDSWRELPKLLRRYARDIDTLERYRLASLAWWNNHCSESVIARQLAAQLNCSRLAV
ncbi:MAG: hypothetical protein ACJ71S_11060 [Acidobacteriaceae bacterium]